jgi:hypothetical protein
MGWTAPLALAAALAAGACAGSSCSAPAHPPDQAVLVVGDSLITQSRTALVDFGPPGAAVTVADALGSAPCDWEHGFIDALTHQRLDYRLELERVKPRYVILMFSGNPGLSGPAAGCVDASRAYSIAGLLASYRRSLTTMADQASQAHAAVYFERPPPRNPAVPVGYDGSTGTDWGYQGLPALADLLGALAAAAPAGDGWTYGARGAAAVSDPGFRYTTRLPCTFLDAPRCDGGSVLVREGGDDAVHFDPYGCGAMLFSIGMESDLPGQQGIWTNASVLERGRHRYAEC